MIITKTQNQNKCEHNYPVNTVMPRNALRMHHSVADIFKYKKLAASHNINSRQDSVLNIHSKCQANGITFQENPPKTKMHKL